MAAGSKIESDDDDDITLAAAFAISADQVAKVHLFGRVKSVATFFGKQLVVHINCLPLVVALIAESDSNAGVSLNNSSVV